MAADIDTKLRTLAEEAKQEVDGEWRYIDGPLMGDIAVDLKPTRPGSTFRLLRVGPGTAGPFIAAASPDVVIALLDRIAALEAARDEACDIAWRFTQPAQIGISASRELGQQIDTLRNVGKEQP